MPSPIAHTTAAYAIFAAFGSGPGRRSRWSETRVPRILVFCVFLCLLPDLPSIAGFVSGDLGRFHNNWEHSLLVGTAVALSFAVVLSRTGALGFRRGFLLVLLCYSSHVVMDYFTIGRGVMLFWPVSAQRWGAPVNLFYGLHWSDGWLSSKHLWTAVTELAFAAFVIGLIWWKRGPETRP